jgi:hypothetical protein
MTTTILVIFQALCLIAAVMIYRRVSPKRSSIDINGFPDPKLFKRILSEIEKGNKPLVVHSLCFSEEQCARIKTAAGKHSPKLDGYIDRIFKENVCKEDLKPVESHTPRLFRFLQRKR